jgi:Trk K+ transport system NAD-binding subunit
MTRIGNDARVSTSPGRHFVVIGATQEAARTCAALAVAGASTEHLAAPSERALAQALSGDVSGVAVLFHDDTQALRYCLAAEHVRPGVPMVVALFDRTAGEQLVRVVPSCTVTSPADIATPSLLAACLPGEHAAIVHRGDRRWSSYSSVDLSAAPYHLAARLRWFSRVGWLTAQLRPHDSGSAILLAGLVGLLALLFLDTTAGIVVLSEPPITALHAAVRTVATAGPVPIEEDHPGYLVFASVAMLLTIGFTAMFTAGVVEHLLSGRLIGLCGRRVLPRRGHVVVVGMGQVGLRLAIDLKALGVGVLGVERDAHAPHLRTARAYGIPVLLGDGTRRRVLLRAGAHRAIALCAVGSDELDNVAAAVTARAVSENIRVVMRAGNHDVIAETSSLFRIGRVCDVTSLTATFVTRVLLGGSPRVVARDQGLLTVWDSVQGPSVSTGEPGDCVCVRSTA